MTITVVSGAPCAGKTTYVAANRQDGDVVVDLDAIAAALGVSGDGSAMGAAFAARTAVIDYILSGFEGDAWIIDTNLLPDSRARYAQVGAAFVVVDPGVDVCVARAADRPDGTVDVIRAWYAGRAEKSTRRAVVQRSALQLAERYPDRLEDILAAVRVTAERGWS